MAILIGLKEGNDSAVEVYTTNTQNMSTGATSFVLSHGLNDANARLVAAYGKHADGWYPVVTVVSQTVNDMTVNFSVPAPAGAQLFWRVDRSI